MVRRLSKPFRRWVKKSAARVIRFFENAAEYDHPEFANHPKHLKIERPRTICNPDRIVMGDNISLGPGSILVPVTAYPVDKMKHPQKDYPVQTFNPRIRIGNRVTSTSNLTISAMSSITIEDDVMFASNINITDGLHGYENANEPYKYQPMCRIAPIVIKHGCWIGQNVVVLPGVTIGELSIIGANSVVSKSIPARSIAIGNPAKVTKRWDETTQQWVAISHSQIST